MFLILKGEVGIFMPKEELPGSGLATADYVATEGKLTGEIAFALKRRRTASLRCLNDTAIIAFSYNDLLKAFSESSV